MRFLASEPEEPRTFGIVIDKILKISEVIILVDAAGQKGPDLVVIIRPPCKQPLSAIHRTGIPRSPSLARIADGIAVFSKGFSKDFLIRRKIADMVSRLAKLPRVFTRKQAGTRRRGLGVGSIAVRIQNTFAGDLVKDRSVHPSAPHRAPMFKSGVVRHTDQKVRVRDLARRQGCRSKQRSAKQNAGRVFHHLYVINSH